MSVRATGVTIMLAASLLAASDPPVTIDITDYVEMPITGKLDGKGQTDGMLARINSLREEPGGATRFFVNDLNGPLYILDKATTKLSVYLDFNGREGHHGLFRRFAYEVGYANGLNSIQFDPDYRANGKFYTVHIEDPALAGSSVPDNTNLPALNLAGYATTTPIPTPGPIQREGVLIEWTDTSPSNATFEGTARELMRVPLNTRIHTLADLSFNPSARPRGRRSTSFRRARTTATHCAKATRRCSSTITPPLCPRPTGSRFRSPIP